MTDTRSSLEAQLAHIAENLRLISERKSEYVEATSIPLDLLKNERELLARQEDLRRRLAALAADTECPYRSLEAFDESHAAYFFGRDDLVAALTAAAQTQPFVAVVGPSGSGKSSAVRAGLIPRLVKSEAPWRYVFCTPRKAPLEELGRALVDLKGVEGFGQRQRDIGDLAALLASDPAAIRRALVEIQADQPAAPLLLVADQFEEVYAQGVPAAARGHFIAALLAAAEAGPRIHVLIAVRSDYYNDILADPQLSRWVDKYQVTVWPPAESDLRAAIEGPARLKGRRFESGLVDRIVRDALGQPGSLPLLQFALTGLWQRQTASGELTHAAYDALGGLAGALSQTAEATYKAYAGQGQQEVLSEMFVRLVEPGASSTHDARRRVARRELEDAFKAAPTPIWQVIGDLAAARLVVVDRDPATQEDTVEVAHESLVGNWPRLKDWVDGDREFRHWSQSRLPSQLHAWQTARAALCHDAAPKADAAEPQSGGPSAEATAFSDAAGPQSGSSRTCPDTLHPAAPFDALLRGEPLATAQRWLRARPNDIPTDQRDYIFHSILHEGRDLQDWLPLFKPLDAALAFLDAYLTSDDPAAGAVAQGIAALRWVDAAACMPGDREADVVARLQPLVLAHPVQSIRCAAAQALCERGQVAGLTALLDQPLATDVRGRLVDALAYVRNLPGAGRRVMQSLPPPRLEVRLAGKPKVRLASTGRLEVRLAAAGQLIWEGRGEFALVLLLIYLGATLAGVAANALWDLLFQMPRLPINPVAPPALPLDLFSHIVALGALLYLFARRQWVDGVPLARRDRLLAAGAGSLVALIFTFKTLAEDLGRRESVVRYYGGFLDPAYLIAWLDTFLLTFLMLWVLIFALRIHVSRRRIVRHALWVAAKTVGAGVLLSFCLLVLGWLFPPGAADAVRDRFTVEKFFLPLLYGTYVAIPYWLRSTLTLAVSLSAFLYGLRLAFPPAFSTEPVRLDHSPAIVTGASASRDWRRAWPRLAIGAALLVALLILTSLVQPWRVAPLRLWCAVKWPERTANAVWLSYEGKPLLRQPTWDAPEIAEIKAGECIQIVGRNTEGSWFAVQLGEGVGWGGFWETDVSWLIQPARLPVTN